MVSFSLTTILEGFFLKKILSSNPKIGHDQIQGSNPKFFDYIRRQ